MLMRLIFRRSCQVIPLIFLIFTLPLPAAARADTSATGQIEGQANAQASITAVQVDYTFGEQIRFQATLEPAVEVREAVLLFDAQGVTHIPPVTIQGFSNGQLQYNYLVTGNSPLRPFSEVRYRYRVTLASGEVVTSPFYSFNYDDNRFEWQTLEEAPLRIHWHSGDITFAQNVIDVAQAGLDKVESLLTDAQSAGILDIYVYASAAELQAVLLSSDQSSVAGHADPDLDLIVVAIPEGPDQGVLIQQRVPHELMHIMLYQHSGAGYRNLPVWLSEGLASTAEMYPNPDYQVLIDNAYAQDTLLPVGSLCSTFPLEASGALLAYAESASFTRYLYSTYGASGITALVDRYADGMSCVRGFETALGLNLIQAERQWRQEVFDENASLAALGNLLPWLVVLLAALFPLFIGLLQARSSRRHQEH